MSARGVKPKPLFNNDPVILLPPDWMTDSQKEIWKVGFANAPAGLLCAMDAGLFGNWVVACDLYRDACERVRATGLIVKSPDKGTPIQNPYLPIINRQAEIMIKTAGELGFTPISRARLGRLDEVSAQEILEDEPLGKKAKANADAITAQEGTPWEALLLPPPSLN